MYSNRRPSVSSFAFRVLPTIIYVTALIAVLYYLGVMRWIIAILGTGSKAVGRFQDPNRSAP